ncbi:hypothetical protein [Myxococcus sp. RHSTA-1-4]|uniref:hypothetical protein n=1 Tax=Myxococcus sp. RHSTA-1-4 TaxID=2874601 RepID=UPI001CBAABCB|nr:hypothetical protein [Myxococcus sp. RHSTA-1-4]MBZ4416123.1 hypothetical protein [Myxococcus sp. RHSTA-1-4]
MDQGRFRRWLLLPGALAAAALLGTACEREKPLPRVGSDYEGVANDQQPTESFRPGQQQPQPKQGGWEDPGSGQPATGGAGHDDEQQGAGTTPDEFRRSQQVPSPGQEDQPGPQDRSGAQGSQGGIGAPGFTTPQEQPTDQGGTRQFEESSGTSSSTMQRGTEQGPRSPPKIDTEEAPKQ